MRRLAYAAVLILPATLECNSIVGVQDVKLIGGGKDGGRRSDASSTGDDDDTTAPPDPPPKKKDPPPSGSSCDSKPACKRTVFVTRAAYTGKLGGVSGADQKCNDAASAVSALSGKTFKAWLSDATSQARSRLPQGTDEYVLTDGSTVASSFADLSDGSLTAAISLDEKGQALPTTGNTVWTGTLADGTVSGYTCSNWTSEGLSNPTADSGQAGDSTARTLDWSEASTTSCNGQLHLYCLEY